MKRVDYVTFCSQCGNMARDGFTTESGEFFFCCSVCGNDTIECKHISTDDMLAKVGSAFGKDLFVKVNDTVQKDAQIAHEGISPDVMFPDVGQLLGQDIFIHNGSVVS